MRREKGWKRFEVVQAEDGEKYFIQINKETGEFYAEIPNTDPQQKHFNLAHFGGKDLEKVRSDLLSWLKDNQTLTWDPVVVIRGRENRWGRSEGSKTHLELEYRRYFRAKRKDGTFLWKEWQADKPTHNVTVCLMEEHRVLRYSKDLWLGLESLSELMRQMNNRIQDLINRNEIESMLVAIAHKGTRALLGPKEEKTEVQA